MGKAIPIASIYAAVAMLLLGCGDPNVRRSELVSSTPAGMSAVAGPGDTVLDVRIVRPLPNAFGKADAFGRTTDAGRVIVRYMGVDGGEAVFARNDIVINSNETTMSRTPLLLPNTSTTTTTGIVGATPFSAQQSTAGYIIVPPRQSQTTTGVLNPIMLKGRAGSRLAVEGYTILIEAISDNAIQYSVQGR